MAMLLLHSLGASDSAGGVEEITAAVGYIAASISMIVWGSMFVLAKKPKVQAISLDPVVPQVYSALGIILSAVFLLIRVKFIWSWWALVAACLWTTSNMFAFPIVKNVGLAAGQGVWSGMIAVVAFVWGAAGRGLWIETGFPRGCHLVSPIPASTGLFAVVAGILGLAWCSANASSNKVKDNRNRLATVDDPLLHPEFSVNRAPVDSIPNKTSSGFWLGVSMAVVMGLIGGSVLIPMKMSTMYKEFPNDIDGTLGFSLSFAVCVTIATSALLGLRCLTLGFSVPAFHVRIVGPACTFQGVLWNIGFVGSTIATNSPLGMSVGYPLTQCSMLIAGLWGVLYYREIKGARILIIFTLSAIILCAGAITLGLFGMCKEDKN